ncbi:hypothetical protein EN974_33340 [Mesorhizobium sp. M7A.F.Ca.CA.001.12.2.1]|uniref:hypothetical protein n=2 Tax=Mesorhizobium TaxID=68287 RepID=UPI000FCCDF6C|nr:MULTISPECIES: hypothetical protein [unclassified Mesorhizobium]RUZ79317.1 hypothetical protein EN947_21050 [Mesorhizobium sp. M7A.F.Ca.US.003.02.2.1]RUY20615.1 hypothetical protein EN979_36055 [Mesorhizobium sp. M7A.F.Ca.US.001.04.2.1]RUY44031.1 hypothetical protein EN978_07475 [Mesorhizobium sp. M7A.F.Ca.US.001.04.1.1]RUY86837.1 hypothetical protein EN974_33340 [Mesorhizobium sp. M7A.F.Ca.CA.001.12.2.1]RUZ16482.1 hypothetical protein EN949_31505 [Mesorhizobium sp. M7A.F.Ca.US.007.01.2.1]
MSAFLAALVAQLWPYLLAGAAGLVALWRAYAMGKAKNQAKQDAADAAARIERQKIDDAVAGRALGDNRGRLGEWSKS